jgi:transposase
VLEYRAGPSTPETGRKDLAIKHRRRFSNEFKRQVVEEHLSGVSTAAQLMRRHDISSGLLYHWKDQYAKGRFDNPPTQEAALEERVRRLEQLVGKLTLENEFLKKAVQRGLLSPPKRSGASWLSIAPSSKAPKGGAN